MHLLVGAYLLALFFLAVFGVHRFWMATKLRSGFFHSAVFEIPGDLPSVLIQLPLYNEGALVNPLLEAVSNFDYPPDRLEIQVLDDSDDGSQILTAQKVEELKRRGFKVVLHKRSCREGFKAGALRSGMARSNAPFIAIFDADFVPPPDFLKRTLGYFCDPKVGMVQTRWGHLNRYFNFLTRGEGLLIDGHFLIEHSARYLWGAYFNFNGTAGIWRRDAIVESGGWEGDTLTEDLDLSYRAQLSGWKFIYEPGVICPAELPDNIKAFKAQQHRWTKGSAQVFKKLILRILFSSISRRQKFEALMHLSGNFCYVFAALAAMLFVPVSIWRRTHVMPCAWLEIAVCVCTLSSMIYFYRRTAALQGRRLSPVDLLSALTLGIGMAAHCAAASLSGLLSSSSGTFIRTPKSASSPGERRRGYKLIPSELFRVHSKELVMTLYLFFGLSYTSSFTSLFAPFGLLLFSGYVRVLLAGLVAGD